jgi:hypothetical protein
LACFTPEGAKPCGKGPPRARAGAGCPGWGRRLVELGDLHCRAVNDADDLLELGGTDFLLVNFKSSTALKFSSARFICGFLRSSQPTMRACSLLDMLQVLLVLGVQLFSFGGNGDFFAPFSSSTLIRP